MEEQHYPSPSRITPTRSTPTTLLQHLLTSTIQSSPINTISLLLNRRIITTTGSSSSSIMEADSINEESDYWAYSKPVIIVDVVWNLAFVIVSIFVMFSTMKEYPSTPIRVWITGYSAQCLLHVLFVYIENKQRWWRWEGLNGGVGGGDEEDNLAVVQRRSVEMRSRATSVVKRLETVNTVVSFLWWMVGFYWIVMGGQALLQDAPRLYWLAVVFLAFDVFFAIFCVVLACMIGIAICCCLPCIIVMLYSMVSREGASEDDIKVLPRYKFYQVVEPLLPERELQHNVALMKMESDGDSITEISLPPDDSECCICLSKYVDGVELHSLPCNHYFHSGCIAKWLRINAKCPLCKYNILDDELV